jgi:DNA-binding IclR family transcriptional regulator
LPAERRTRPAAAPVERETSIRRGVEVLLSLASEESLAGAGLGVTQIADLLGREKSQVSRALKALSEYGLVERNKDSSYRLGWRLYALAQLAGERRLLEAATPMIRRLAHLLGERVHLSVLQGTQTLTVVSESPGRTVETVGWAGRVTPAYCTSAGRALLLDWDADEIAAVFAGVEFVALGPNTIASAGELAAAVAAARPRGFVVVDEEFEPGLIGVAVPVTDPRGSIIAALNVSAPRYRFADRVGSAAGELLAVSAELSRSLGDPGAIELSAEQ